MIEWQKWTGDDGESYRARERGPGVTLTHLGLVELAEAVGRGMKK